jgi:hypothetical protein
MWFLLLLAFQENFHVLEKGEKGTPDEHDDTMEIQRAYAELRRRRRRRKVKFAVHLPEKDPKRLRYGGRKRVSTPLSVAVI